MPIGLGEAALRSSPHTRMVNLSPDGRRIYFMQRNRDAPPNSVTVVLGWQSWLN